MTWEEVVAIGSALPDVAEAISFRTPSLRAFGKLITRLRSEDASLVLIGVGFDERDFLIEASPQTFHTNPHYRDYPSVLARLATVDAGTVSGLLERRWRAVAPKRVLKAWEAAKGG